MRIEKPEFKQKKLRDTPGLLPCSCIKLLDFGTCKFVPDDEYGFKYSDKGCRRLLFIRGNFEAGVSVAEFDKYFISLNGGVNEH